MAGVEGFGLVTGEMQRDVQMVAEKKTDGRPDSHLDGRPDGRPNNRLHSRLYDRASYWRAVAGPDPSTSPSHLGHGKSFNVTHFSTSEFLLPQNYTYKLYTERQDRRCREL